MKRACRVALVILAWCAGRVAGEDDPVAAARRHWLRGRYDEASAAYTKLADDPQTAAAASIGLSRCFEARGEWKQAVEIVEQAAAQHAGDPALQTRLAELALARRDLERARGHAERALAQQPGDLAAQWVLAQCADLTGNADETNRRLQAFVRYYNEHEVKDPAALVIIGQAAAEHARRNLRGRAQSEQLGFVLNELFDAAIQADADYWPARYQSGVLFLEKYKKGDAGRDLEAALAINSQAAEIHCALGQLALADYDLDKGHAHGDRALSLNPHLPAARRLKADLFLARDQFAEARAELERALAIHPADEETLGRLAACHWLERRRDESDRLAAAVSKRNPKPARFYHTLAEHLENHRRFDDAERYFRLAIDLGPHLTAARTGLGMLYMRVGREAEAAKILDEAFQADPFSVRIKNMLEVLDQLAGYRVIETPHFRVKVDEKLDGLLGRYAAKYLEQVYAELSERFAYEVPEPIAIEIFNKGRGQSAHEWFSARTVGLPWIGTVGACTGKVVAMASPRGVEKPFNWARVLKHEVAHVITLQQTRFHIPHWYTEALAVEAEAYPRPELWDRLLAERVPAGTLLDLDNINLAFVRPKSPLDWQAAYCQSELYVDYMRARFGRESPAKLLAAYRDGLLTNEAVPQVFGVSKEDFESGYREFVRRVTSEIKLGPVEPPMPLAELEKAHAARPDDPDIAARLALERLKRRSMPQARELARQAVAARPNHPLGCYVLARLYLAIGETELARKVLEPALDRSNPDPRVLDQLADLYVRAKEYDAAEQLYQLGQRTYPSDSKWSAGLARIYLLTDRPAQLAPVLDEISRQDADELPPRKKRMALAADASDWKKARDTAWSVLHIDAYDVDAHQTLGDAHAALKEWPAAIEEYRVVLELNAAKNGARLRLARALKEAGMRDEARKELEAVLKAEPNNETARKLRDEFAK
jgi:tetratricopeptide (TPR) repeat protein